MHFVTKYAIVLAVTLYLVAPTQAQWTRTIVMGGGPPRSIVYDNGDLFAGTARTDRAIGGVFRSGDNGSTWIPCSNGIPNVTVYSLLVRDSNVFAATDSGAYVSTDRGATWAAVNNGLGSLNVLAIQMQGSTLLAGTNGGGIYRSTNLGASWTQSNEGLSTSTVQSLGMKGGVWFAGNRLAGPGVGIFRSTDDGVTWGPTAPTHPWVTCFAETDSFVIAGTYGGVVVSTDFGDHWTNTDYVNRPECVAVAKGLLVVGTFDGFVYASKDFTSWESIKANIPMFESVSSIAITSDFMFVATSQENYPGVWRRPMSEIVTSAERGAGLPAATHLFQNYPNPFNPNTTISYSLPRTSSVTLKVYNALGEEVAALVNEDKSPGVHDVTFNAEGLPTGMYVYRLQAGDFVESKKLLLVK